MKIRPATKTDITAIEMIFDKYWQDSFRQNLSQKLQSFLNQDSIALEQDLQFVVAEEEEKILGVGVYRRCPSYMMRFTETDSPAELYVLAVLEKHNGVGSVLREERLRLLKTEGYTEAVLFSGESHSDSWSFHDDSDFYRVGEMTAPNGEKGIVWRLKF